MWTVLGVFAVFVVLAYLFLVPDGGFVKKQPTDCGRYIFLVFLSILISTCGLVGGVYLAIHLGKSFPTYQKKIGEVEYTTNDGGETFIIESYEPSFVYWIHNLVGIPSSVNGAYEITKKVKKITQKKGE